MQKGEKFSDNLEKVEELMVNLPRKGLAMANNKSEVTCFMNQLDQANKDYFQLLLDKNKNSVGPLTKYKIFESNLNLEPGDEVVYPAPLIPEDLKNGLPLTHYSNLKSEKYQEKAKEVTLWYRPMHAGLGSSVERKAFLARVNEGKMTETPLGAKGTDLSIQLQNQKNQLTRWVSLAELQLLRVYKLAKQNSYKKIIFQDLVGPDTKESIENTWRKTSFINPKLSYDELFKTTHQTYHFPTPVIQDNLPTINSKGELTLERKAPGGHGFFGVEAMMAALNEDHPISKNAVDETIIGVLSNGEDLNGIPDSYILGWMAEEQIPIAMIMTEKTSIDLKGGQLALQPKGQGSDISTVILLEAAQAEMANQKKLFQNIGLGQNELPSYFNTNILLINYKTLMPMLKKHMKDNSLSTPDFLKIIAPDLIQNRKKVTSPEGTEKTYTQLEGAMGQVVLNLDKYWRKHYKTPIVTFLNINSQDRTNFFAPIKSGFDFFMQFHSDRFEFTLDSLSPKCLTPGKYPAVNLEDSYYKEVENILQAFENCKIKELEKLTIKGKVKLPSFTLKGNVIIDNTTNDLIDLSQEEEFKDRVFANVNITINDQGTKRTFIN